MNYILRFCLCLATIFVLGSCAEDGDMTSYDEFEAMALHEWMTVNKPELLGNLQEEGGYYVEVLEIAKDKDINDKTNPPISDTAVWVTFEFTGRDLAGNVAITRNEIIATQQDTYTKFTHYVPMYRYISTTDENTLGEGTTLAMSRELTLGADYATANGFKEKIEMRVGTEVILYLPSSVVASGDSYDGTGGYEGQFSLDAGLPFVVRMKVVSIVKNPIEREGTDVDAFATKNGGLRMPPEDEDEEDKSRTEEEEGEGDVIGPEHPDHPYNDPEDWRNVIDSIPQLYVNHRFTPTTTFKYNEVPDITQYKSVYSPYNNFAQMETKIVEVLKERFDLEENPYLGVHDKGFVGDSVKVDGAAKVWYIGRFLDGFIFDTNIDEVREIVFGKVGSAGKAFDYTTGISAWKITIPNLKYGQWAAILTTSAYAYGAAGLAGGTKTSGGTSSYDPYAYMNHMNYSNNYYGNGGYYDSYYNNYMGGYGGYGMNYGMNYETTTTPIVTTTETDFPPYTPLIFEIYIEPED